jgi:hypothetical protein
MEEASLKTHIQNYSKCLSIMFWPESEEIGNVKSVRDITGQGQEMVQREPSLAELLADDTGNFRPEMVDLFTIDQPQPAYRRRRSVMPWLIACIISILLIFIIKALLDKDDKERYRAHSKIKSNMESRLSTSPSNHSKAFPENSIGAIKVNNKRLLRNTMEDKRHFPANNKGNSLNNRYHQVKKHLGTAVVFGFNVNIRQFPRLSSPIFRQTNQGENFQVLSFSNGWYEVVMGENQAAFIFGAYLLPVDFKLSSHWVGLTMDRTKVLLAEDYRSEWFQIILPDGKKHYIRKKEVKVVK